MIPNLLNVPNPNVVSGASAASGSSGTPTTPSTTNTSSTSGVDSLANEQTFLQLFVAQLKNQNPDTPQDPTQFVSQLAQMSGLEQSLQMRQDLDAILKTLQTNSAASISSTPKT